MARKVETVEEALQDQVYKEALVELLYQLADDDFILSYRGSEWLGLVPHIEEDVSMSSLVQDTMGHAAMFYEMLEQLGEGKADDVAHLRSAEKMRNAIFVEHPNGPGHYLTDPDYDWGYTVMRWYLYEMFKRVRFESLLQSSYTPLAQVVRKMMSEQQYHIMHWSIWMRQLANSTAEANQRLKDGLTTCWKDVASLFDMGEKETAMVEAGLIESSAALLVQWEEKVKAALEQNNLSWLGTPARPVLTGRDGKHTEALNEALDALSEVYRIDPVTSW
jgi:ring-1,2-phenylacetyl-CoA epoxidase subunit PaaC